jgi:hypothetical protein
MKFGVAAFRSCLLLWVGLVLRNDRLRILLPMQD